MKPISIISAGAWGTTLAILLAKNDRPVTLWAYPPELAASMELERVNKLFLPDFAIPPNVKITTEAAVATVGADIVLFVPPSKVFRSVVKRFAVVLPADAVIVSATKGLEEGTDLRMSQILEQELPKVFHHRITVLSGPNLAKELAAGQPAASVIAGKDSHAAQKAQKALSLPTLRLYTNSDIIGVELGGTLKNIIAIAAGIVDGLSLGDNAKAALLIRGISEIARLGVALGGNKETFFGLSGMGDLITTCSSNLSRNHYVGLSIAQGQKLADILADLAAVAEGVPTTRAALDLAKKHRINMPITEQVAAVLFNGKDPRTAIGELMSRSPKEES